MGKPSSQTSTSAPSRAGSRPASNGTAGSLNPLLLLGIVVVLVLAGIFVFSRRGGGGTAATQPVASVSTDPASLQTAQGMELGSPTAPVQLHEYADFQCPACQQFSTFIHPLIKERLIDTGLVRMVRYDFPLVNAHQHAFLAARAARCAADQGKYWEYHDVLYARQASWSTLRSPVDVFGDYSEAVGMNRKAFDQCLRSDQHAEEVTRNLRLGEALGVTGTPSFLINGQRASFGTYQELEARVMEIAGRASATTAEPTVQ
ncbi:MAG: DsbA family protein [Gemmatimonadota bacterium]|nr:DsbA family protein [Gemmatimonadota bacterium]